MGSRQSHLIGAEGGLERKVLSQKGKDMMPADSIPGYTYG